MRIAIIGAGFSGLTAAYRLCVGHEVTVFEANEYLGGRTNTVEVDVDGERQVIDTGFIVFNDWAYPNFIALLDELGVASRPTSMSFSVRCDAAKLEYNDPSKVFDSTLTMSRRPITRWELVRAAAVSADDNPDFPRHLLAGTPSLAEASPLCPASEKSF